MSSADVLVVGAGVVGLACAAALAARARVCLIGEHRPGEASRAAGGILAPSIELPRSTVASPAHMFALAARDRYPEYLAELCERSGREVALNRLGVLDVALDETGAATLRAAHQGAGYARWLDAPALREIEPALGHAAGALLYPRDSAVDTDALLAALVAALDTEPRVARVDATVQELTFVRDHVTCVDTRGTRYTARQLVLAAGAWAPRIAGLPRALPIEPVRGQIVAFGPVAGTSPLRRVVYGHDRYLVPRPDGRTLAGSTMEHVGFDPSTTHDALATIRSAATITCPPLAGARVATSWAGLRPMTPDQLPILGRDPDHPSLIYACGHSRNGVLMAPLTADCVAALVTGDDVAIDLTPFSVTRFS